MQPLPVIIEQLIQKVTDKGVHPEQRQHYANSLKNIIEQGDKAYKQWEKEWENRRK